MFLFPASFPRWFCRNISFSLWRLIELLRKQSKPSESKTKLQKGQMNNGTHLLCMCFLQWQFQISSCWFWLSEEFVYKIWTLPSALYTDNVDLDLAADEGFSSLTYITWLVLIVDFGHQTLQCLFALNIMQPNPPSAPHLFQHSICFNYLIMLHYFWLIICSDHKVLQEWVLKPRNEFWTSGYIVPK